MNLDFSAAHYLGIRHGSGDLPAWDSLSTGAPAALYEPPAALALGKSIARLQGLAEGLTGSSTLHLFWDWFGGLGRRDFVFADAQLYRVGAWGVERAAGKGVDTAKFRHQSATSLERLTGQLLGRRQRPVVVTDGWCPFCGKAAPLRDYLEIIEPYGGLLVLDDTQALGIFGKKPDALMPYGFGGGGLLRHLTSKNENVVAISSLAKAFGAPLAAICGSETEIQRFKQRSETRVHTSPPSAVAVAAGKNALHLNTTLGDERRDKLLQNVLFFKEYMAENGFETKGGFFPVQTIEGLDKREVQTIQADLWKKGLRTVPVLAHSNNPKLCWLLSARHSEAAIERACRMFFSTARTKSFSLLKPDHYEIPARRNFNARTIG